MAFNVQLDLFSAIQKFIEFRKINEWIKLGISLFCSFWLSSTFVTGSALLARQPWPMAIGAGLVSGSTLATVLWRNSPLPKGTQLALPIEEAAKELNTNVQVLTK
jgi:hypothetical protein